jgi:hypothetical protein
MASFIQRIFSSLTNALKSRTSSNTSPAHVGISSEHETWFYEEEFKGIELIPFSKANWELLTHQAQEIEKFSEAHKTEVGWTDVYLSQSPPESISAMGIQRGELIPCIPTSLPMFVRIHWTDGTHHSICEKTIAFGPHPALSFFVDFENDSEELAETLWLRLDLQSQDDVDVALELMQALTRWPLMLYDSGWLQLIPIADTNRLTTYFQKRVSVFGKNGKF